MKKSITPMGKLIIIAIIVAAVYFGYKEFKKFIPKEISKGNSSEVLNDNSTNTPNPKTTGKYNTLFSLSGSTAIGYKLAPAAAEAYLTNKGYTVEREQQSKELIVVKGKKGETTDAIVIKSTGTKDGFADLLKGSCEIAMASRTIKDEENQKFIQAGKGDITLPANEHVIGLDGVAIIVNRNNPINKIDLETLEKIFRGEITDWKDVDKEKSGAIHIYTRDKKAGILEIVKSMVLRGVGDLTESAVTIVDNVEVSKKIEDDPDGITFVALPFIKNNKALALFETGAQPFTPNFFSVSTEDYMLTRRIYFYTPLLKGNDEKIREFIEFVQSDAIQESIVKGNDFVPLNVTKTAKIENVLGKEYEKETKGSERLSINFRFKTGSFELDNKALQDVKRIADFFKKEGMNFTITLIGFTDNIGSRASNLELSKKRAQKVEEELGRFGITKPYFNISISGYGPDYPVASNEGEDGKNRNRRVEIWYKK